MEQNKLLCFVTTAAKIKDSGELCQILRKNQNWPLQMLEHVQETIKGAIILQPSKSLKTYLYFSYSLTV